MCSLCVHFASAGAHTQKRLSIVQRNSFRAAALILGLLLVVAVVVLSKLCEDLVFIFKSYPQ